MPGFGWIQSPKGREEGTATRDTGGGVTAGRDGAKTIKGL